MNGRTFDRQRIKRHPWLLAGMVALAYLLTARLSFLTALPPGNVSVLWPASGIALAAAVLFGRRMLLGVWLGSFLANAGSFGDFSGLPVAAAIAAGRHYRPVSPPNFCGSASARPAHRDMDVRLSSS